MMSEGRQHKDKITSFVVWQQQGEDFGIKKWSIKKEKRKKFGRHCYCIMLYISYILYNDISRVIIVNIYIYIYIIYQVNSKLY